MKGPAMTEQDLAAAREKAAEEMLAKHEMLHLGTRYDKWGLVSTIAQALASARAAGEAAAGAEAEGSGYRRGHAEALAQAVKLCREQKGETADASWNDACETCADEIEALSPQGGPDGK